MGIALSTAGVNVGYAVETTKGTRPTTGYSYVPDIKETPELNPEPNTLDSTTLSELEYKTYIKGLKDLGGALSFTANFTEDLMTEWDKLVVAYKAAKAEGKSVWFVIEHPELEKAAFFTGEPSEMGLPSTSVDSILETSVYVTPTGAPIWEAKPTVSQS